MKPQPKSKGIIRPQGMSDKAFDSMVKRNNMTDQKVDALRVSLERGEVK